MTAFITAPGHRDRPVGRRRLIAAGTGALAYLAAYAAVVLLVASLFEPTGRFVLIALAIAAVALVAGGAALGVDVLLSRLRRSRGGGVAVPRWR